MVARSNIHEGKANVEFNKLAFSRYSVMAFHDMNNNNTMDHSFLKLPTEAFGFSNNWNFSLFSGKPTFKKTSVAFDDKHKKISINVE